MKKASSEIFDLIRSLTKAEKRYFQIYSRRHFPKDNQYLRLFERIAEADVYNESALIEEFSDGMSASHFAVLKKQLYDNILDSLHRFDEFAHPEQQIQKGIHFCSLLLKKGLFSQCAKQLEKYRNKAYSIEKFEQVLELIDIQKRLIARQQYSAHSYDMLMQLQAEQENCMKQIQITGNYWIRSSRIFKMHAEKVIAAGKQNAVLEELILQDPYFNSDTYAVNMRSKLDQLQVNALYAFVMQDAQRAYELNFRFLSLLDDAPQFKMLYADRYFSVLNNYLIDSLLLQKYGKLIPGIRTLRSLPSQKEFKHINNLEANVFRLGFSLEMNYYVSTQQFSIAVRNKDAIEEGIRVHGKKMPKASQLTLRYLITYSLFCCGDFDACLDMLNALLHQKDAEMIPDIYRDARMMQLLVHFALGNYQLLESMLVSLQRLLNADRSKLQTHKVVLRYIKQYIQKINKPDKTLLEQTLKQLMENDKEKAAFNNIDYVYWAENLNRAAPLNK